MTNKKSFKEKIWVPSETKFAFREQINPQTGEKKFILKGLMLPFNKISRNGVMYNIESIKKKYPQLVGKPMMYNHKVDGQELPIGHFTESFVDEKADVPGWYYTADIDPEERNFIRKLERGDLRHVSIQLIGDSVEEAFTPDGKAYTEAWVGDIIEGSIVPAPGFLDTSAKFAEAFGNKKEEIKVPIEKGDTILGGKWRNQKIVVKDIGTNERGEPTVNGKSILNVRLSDNKEGLIQPPQGMTDKSIEEELTPCQKWLQGLDHAPNDEEVHAWAAQNGADINQVEATLYQLAKAHVDELKEDVSTSTAPGAITPQMKKESDDVNAKRAGLDESCQEGEQRFKEDTADQAMNNFNGFPMDQFLMGLKVEQEHNATVDGNMITVARIALDHLLEDPEYYTKLTAMEQQAKTVAQSVGEEIVKEAYKEANR